MPYVSKNGAKLWNSAVINNKERVCTGRCSNAEWDSPEESTSGSFSLQTDLLPLRTHTDSRTETSFNRVRGISSSDQLNDDTEGCCLTYSLSLSYPIWRVVCKMPGDLSLNLPYSWVKVQKCLQHPFVCFELQKNFGDFCCTIKFRQFPFPSVNFLLKQKACNIFLAI